MIIYQAAKTEFLQHAWHEDIEEVVSRHFRSATGRGVAAPEIQAWKHSLLEMAKVLQDEEIPGDAWVAIEYQLPQTSKRIDFVITGKDAAARPKAVIVELKQWSQSRRSEKDGIVWARRGGQTGEREGTHPSYQAWSYAAYLEDFNAAVQDGGIVLQPCAYLHNHLRDGEIDHPHYSEHLARAPLFLARERAKLQAFIRQHVRHGDNRGVLYAIENGRIRPSKMLIDSVAGLLQGRTEFVLIDDQKVVHETILQVEARAAQRKQVVIVKGGPGTGKSVIAINLLGTLLARQRNARYVSKNAAPRAVYEAKLAGTFTKTRISNLFSGSGAFVDDEADSYDTLIVDEAHRLNEKSGLYRNLGDNQVRELIRSARCTVFFVDDDQRVTLLDIGLADELRRRAREFDAEVTELELSSQFRCNGSDGYLEWLDSSLDIRGGGEPILDTAEFDFRVFDDPAELHALVELKNRANNRSRECHLFVDISHGAKVRVRFAGDGVVARFPDGAILYRCEMEAIPGLFAYATGEARLRNSQLQLKLFHHTTGKAARSIEASGEFWTSAWNLQGTKKHADRVFLYLTPLDRIRSMADLQEIAMASSGQVSLRLDGNNSNKPDLLLKVPRESTENRTHALPCWVDSAALAPQHIYRHDHGEGVYYQVAHPFIHRAGANPGQNIVYTASELVITHPLRPDYVVVGDASTITGLRSPFDEEGPDDIWKIVRPAEDGNFIDYWRENADTRIFDGLPFAPAVFRGSE